VLACDERICWWADELKKAGLEGSMDELRARAYLDLILNKDSRPAPSAAPSPSAVGPARRVPGRPARPLRGSLPGSP
jgi:hypothetical protein